MAELSQAALEELVEGKPQTPRAVFYEKAALQVAESKLAGHRCYRTMVYVKLMQSGVTDNISYPARKKDIDDFPEEYQYFLGNRQGSTRAVLIDIIPNLNIANKQELVDLGLSTIDRLADSVSVPPHLEHIRQSAKVFQSVLQEQLNVSIEEDSIEERSEASSFEGERKAISRNPTTFRETEEAGNVSASHRQGNDHDVRRSSVQEGGQRGKDSHPRGLYQARQVNSGKSVDYLLDVNWSISF
jgi:hypothetical protein